MYFAIHFLTLVPKYKLTIQSICLQAVYLGMISYTDWIFGQLLEGLALIEGGAMAARTAVFFSSDHGDFGGDYGLVEKWQVMLIYNVVYNKC